MALQSVEEQFAGLMPRLGLEAMVAFSRQAVHGGPFMRVARDFEVADVSMRVEIREIAVEIHRFSWERNLDAVFEVVRQAARVLGQWVVDHRPLLFVQRGDLFPVTTRSAVNEYVDSHTRVALTTRIQYDALVGRQMLVLSTRMLGCQMAATGESMLSVLRLGDERLITLPKE